MYILEKWSIAIRESTSTELCSAEVFLKSFAEVKDKFRMEEEEEKYQEFRESVAEMKDELRMETEQERSRLKRIFITTSVLLFYVSSH